MKSRKRMKEREGEMRRIMDKEGGRDRERYGMES